MSAKSHPIRFITAASLFDGHDAAINIMRRLLQSLGAEVIHLGHNRSVAEIITAAIQEDVQGIAVSSYQGGHLEFFKYMIDLLKQKGRSDIKVFGGGGGVITAEEIQQLQNYGVERIYSPADGQHMGLKGMISHMLHRAGHNTENLSVDFNFLKTKNELDLAPWLTAIEENRIEAKMLKELLTKAESYKNIPVIGITGTGGAGKSSLTDELIRRFCQIKDDLSIAVIALDPTKRKSGGALLGDRIRMNAIYQPNIFMRSFATRDAETEIIPCLREIIASCKIAGFELIIVETPGIGQGDAGIVPYVDIPLYVMTPEFGAASQLEKIDMLDYAEAVAINKFDRRGAFDALRDVRKQLQRNREEFSKNLEEMPVFGTMAAKFNDEGVDGLFYYLLEVISQKYQNSWQIKTTKPLTKMSDISHTIIPPTRQSYLLEIVETVKKYNKNNEVQVKIARDLQQLKAAEKLLANESPEKLSKLIQERETTLTEVNKILLKDWDQLKAKYAGEEIVFQIRDKEIHNKIFFTTLSGTRIPKVSMPQYEDDGERLKWLLKENVPGEFPYTAGVFPFKRIGEDPSRMFAGEGDPFRTNKRFKLLSEHAEANRLSTAFDSVTLYGFDPDERPDIYGKIGNSGVSIATLDDMKVLYDGFDLTHPKTSVSMTINGPAPTILAMFLNTAIDQKIEKFIQENQHQPSEEEAAAIQEKVLSEVRGTVQADILKEDQGQNTCIFSTEFSLKMMADIQEYFVQHKVRNFYSVSISGYHIAEAGANPISQLAFTLANAFTYVEAYIARGMHIDDFAHNLSFFFSNGMDAEYAVMGRVARRIWAVTMRDKYHANSRSQKLKYHIQTSGRSLHSQEMAFNDIRTTLEALIAIYDNCNSLHTNAYDEALTTPTDESVRRALAIQLIINNEWGLAKNENLNQGSFIIDELTDLVEQAVLRELESINQRGGVLGAMETGYQRGKIQEESLLYEMKKHDGSLPIIGVNTFKNEKSHERSAVELRRSTEAEKQSQLKRLAEFQKRNAAEASIMLERLKDAAKNNKNVFAMLMEAVRVCSLGQITQALFEVGGQYRRNM